MRGVGAIHKYRRKGKDLYMQALQKYNTHLGLSFFFCRLIRTEGSDFFWKQEDKCDKVYIRVWSRLLTNTVSPAYTTAQKKLSDAEFDYNEKKKMILGGVKKINLEICTSVQNW